MLSAVSPEEGGQGFLGPESLESTNEMILGDGGAYPLLNHLHTLAAAHNEPKVMREEGEEAEGEGEGRKGLLGGVLEKLGLHHHRYIHVLSLVRKGREMVVCQGVRERMDFLKLLEFWSKTGLRD
jgi:hypothetical protein